MALVDEFMESEPRRLQGGDDCESVTVMEVASAISRTIARLDLRVGHTTEHLTATVTTHAST